jgi:hypothetical protein
MFPSLVAFFMIIAKFVIDGSRRKPPFIIVNKMKYQLHCVHAHFGEIAMTKKTGNGQPKEFVRDVQGRFTPGSGGRPRDARSRGRTLVGSSIRA